MNWIKNVETIDTVLKSLSIINNDGENVDADTAFKAWVDITIKIRENSHTVFLIGNGASASIASHVAADLAKNAHVHTEVFSDLSLITAIANDMSFEEVFAEPLRRRMKPGDMLVAISSSGQSVNVLRAVKEARDIGGLVITLSAMKPDNPIHSEGNLNFYVSAMTYGMAETCHAAILHYWLDQIVATNKQGKSA